MDVRKYEVRDKGYMNAILLEAPDEFWASEDKISAGDVVIFNHPVTTHDWVWRQIYDSDVGDITDPEDGYDIKISRVKKKGNTRYERKVVPKSRPIADSPEGIKAILDQMYNLSEIWSRPDDEIFEKIKAGANRLDSLLSSRLARAQQHVSSPGEEVDKLAGASRATTTAPPPPPSAPTEQNPADNTKVWYMTPGDDDVKEGTIGQIKKQIGSQEALENTFIMPYDQSEDWKTAEDWGLSASS